MAKDRPPIHKNVYLLGWVSLFTDLSSQMIYPLVPVYLQNLGASTFIIGIIEGVAESIGSFLKVFFGNLSDRLNKRKVFVFLGYGLSSLSKPLLYLANSWPLVMLLRISDRMGKAIRNPARDALISHSVESNSRGKAFGIHRGMDRIGAAGGSLLAVLVLWLTHESIQMVFLFAGIPAFLALMFIPFVKENFVRPEGNSASKYRSNRKFKFFLLSIIIFTLGNSSNAFLILKARENGIMITMIPVLWLVYNIVASIASPYLGALSDKFGRKILIQASFIVYTLIYIGFAFSSSELITWLLFASYGIYYGLSNGIFKAYIADQSDSTFRATAYGIFQTATGLALLPASMIMGYTWDLFGSEIAFGISAAFSLIGFLIFTISQLHYEKFKG